MENNIEKHIELKAPLSRVWLALTDSRQFSEWFGVKIDGPFIAGQSATSNITLKGYEHLKIWLMVQDIQPESLFSYLWHPYAIDPNIDYSGEEPTLVEFRLSRTESGTLLRVTESGFDKIPAHRRAEAMRMNDGGWAQQIKNIERYVATQI